MGHEPQVDLVDLAKRVEALEKLAGLGPKEEDKDEAAGDEEKNAE